MPKKHDYPTNDDTDRADGGAVYWSRLCRRHIGQEVIPSWMVLVQCPDKKHPARWVRACDVILPDFNTLDRACYREQSPRKRKDKITLHKGTVVDFSERDPGNVHLVRIVCRGCSEPKFTDYSNLQRYIAGNQFWDELCSECVQKRGSVRKFTGWRTAPSGTRVFIPAEMDGEAIFKYVCGHERKARRGDAVNNWDVANRVCPTCRRQAIRDLCAQLSSGGAPAANGQGNGAGKKPGREALITEAKVREAYKVLGQYAPQEKVSEHVGVDPRALRDWHRKQGLNYRQCQQRFGGTGSN